MEQAEAFPVHKLSFGTIFKITFTATLSVWAVIVVLIVFGAFVSPSAITVNGKAATSTAEALMAAPIFVVIGSLLSAGAAAIEALLIKTVGRALPLGNVRLS